MQDPSVPSSKIHTEVLLIHVSLGSRSTISTDSKGTEKVAVHRLENSLKH